MDNDERKTVTFQMKYLGDMVTSPRKQKDGTHVKGFQFATVNKNGTKHGVSFYPTLHRKLVVTNNDRAIALKMKNVVFENNQYKLDAETCLAETVKLQKPFSMKFEPVKSIDNIIFEHSLDTMTSIRGEVTNIEVNKKKNIQLSISTQLLIIESQLFYSPTRS